jgi:hypothetical protein
MATSAQVQRKAERARERVSHRIADLRSQVSPRTVVSDLLEGLNIRGRRDDILADLDKEGQQQSNRFTSHRRRRCLADIFRVKEFRFDKTPPNTSPRTKEKARAAQR